ncbi:MAG: DUF3750 domain-containing protein, partial [Bradyrhizobiaceae bacterium]
MRVILRISSNSSVVKKLVLVFLLLIIAPLSLSAANYLRDDRR